MRNQLRIFSPMHGLFKECGKKTIMGREFKLAGGRLEGDDEGFLIPIGDLFHLHMCS